MDQILEFYIEKFLSVNDSLRRKMGNDYREITEQTGVGITGPQVFLLRFIKEQGSCKITQLAEKMDVKPSAITVMIDRLVHSNLVVRIQDPHDRRVVLVELTEQGDKELDQAKEMIKQIMANYFSKINQNELANFIHTFEKLVSSDEVAQKE